jgi:queuine tRNA-ribosyltransferase subunit QTRTD1
MTNADEAFTIYTLVGFRRETVDDYIKAAGVIGPDVFIGPADIVWAPTKSQRRIEKMGDRTERWMDKVFRTDWTASERQPALFAPVLPVPMEQQRFYLSMIADHVEQLSGLAIYDPIALDGIPDSLTHLVRFSLAPPASPHDILKYVVLGVDVFTIPFITLATDAGIALTFTFPPPPPPTTSEADAATAPASLGLDMFPESHAMTTSPLGNSCTCYACQTSSRAYIQHLLGAKEMTGWLLLQVHNHAVMDTFFANIRRSIEVGTFEQDTRAFESFYASELPAQTGSGPRYVITALIELM